MPCVDVGQPSLPLKCGPPAPAQSAERRLGGPQAARLLTLPLPESQRALGPYRARTVLEVLTGSSWTWHEDPVQRLVWFTVKSTGQPVQLSDSQVPVRAAEVQAITTGVAASIVEAHDLPQQNTHESPAGSQ